MREYAADFETYYSAECSITVQGVYGYLRHPDADIYMVSIWGDDFQWVGHPKDLDWSRIGGKGTRWLSHNAAFDGAVFDRLVELGVVDAKHQPEEWLCTADCAAYHGLPRNLKGAVAATTLAERFPVSKETRNAMKGKRWEDMSPEFKKEVSDYALRDSEVCYHLWKLLGPHWPQDERDFSKATMLMSWQGIPVNLEKIEWSINHLKDQIWEAAEQIPWYPENPPLSKKQLDDQCRAVGIEPPDSLAMDSESCAAWEDKHGGTYPWVSAMRVFRRCNALVKKLEAMKIRTHGGRMYVETKYFGGHTGRDSGGGGVNVQNFSRSTLFGVNFRELIEAGAGKTLVLSDFSQIEPRALCWLCQDTQTLKLCADGMSPYEAHARVSMGWTSGVLKKENPQMYSLSKARVLGLGFGVGFEKFLTMAKNYISDPAEYASIFAKPTSETQRQAFTKYWLGVGDYGTQVCRRYNVLDDETKDMWVNSWEQVMDYRKSNPLITGFWELFKEQIKKSHGSSLSVTLPSGRVMTYRNVRKEGDGYTCAQVRNGMNMRTRITGPLVVENVTQAFARDVFRDGVLRLLRHGYKIIMRIHDEVVIEVDESDADATLENVTRIMSTPPTWCPNLPVGVEAEISKVYKK